MEEKLLNFVLIGRSGSGKGTQAKLLMEKFGNLYYLSSGQLYRNLATKDTDVAERIKKILDAGVLLPNDLAVSLWMAEISYNLKKDQGLIADGFPRRLEEAEDLYEFMDFLERNDSTFYLLIDISREEAFNRLTKRRIYKNCGKLIPWVGEFKKLENCDECGGELETRPDDTDEAINNRMDYFEERVVPAIKFYEEKGKLIKINGEQPIEDVFKEILEKMK